MRIKQNLNRADDATRRAFLTNLAAGGLGVSMLPHLPQAEALLAGASDGGDDPIPLRPATAQRVIYVYLSGGMSHLDTFDLKPGHENQGPTEAIRTSADGVQISSHMPNLARHMDKVAIVNSMNSTQGAHAQGRYFMHTSYELRGTIKHPSMGAWLSRMAGRDNPTLPGHVAIQPGQNTASAGFFESAHAPLPIGNPEAGLQHSRRNKKVTEKQFDRRLDRLRRMNESFEDEFDLRRVRSYEDAYEQAVRLMSSQDLEAFDISLEPEYLRAAYGNDRFGQGCLLARRLVEHGVRFVEVVTGGWDTHSENFEAMEDKLPTLDRGLSALLGDLDARGLLEDTLVVVATEFGRTPKINQRTGRDHYPKAFSCLLAGGGIVGGQKWGKTDERGMEVIENKVTVPDFNATIGFALGLPLDHIMHSPSKRPFQVAHKGRPITELFG